MIYVVSGFPRSGTTMMMRAMAAGGLEMIFDPDREEFLELSSISSQLPDFPVRCEGKVAKVKGVRLPFMTPAPCRIVFMRRSLVAMRESWAARFGGKNGLFEDEQRFNDALTLIVATMKDRKSVASFDEVQLQDVVDNPTAVFSALAATGWPINVDEAAKIPSLGGVNNGF